MKPKFLTGSKITWKTMLISDYLREDCILVNFDCNTKDDVLKMLAELQFDAHPDVNKDETIASLYERENLLSTGIGEGIAIPHARIETCNEICVSFGLLKTGIDFKALDDKPVRIILLILFPKDNVNLQLRFLARVSRVLQSSSLRDDLYHCSNPQDVIGVFGQYEEKHFH